MLLCPQVQRDRGKFVDQRVGQTVFREVNGFDVGVAGIAALDSHVRKLFSGIDRKFALVLLAASGTDDATELPFAKTETADQIPVGTVA
jgi:hypothetical protein